MGRKKAEPGTLAALAEAGGNYVVCGNCGHFAPLDIRALVIRFGWGSAIEEATPQLRCKICGRHKPSIQHGQPGPPPVRLKC